ncbi:MAG TPA: hypothetical protein VF177_02475 [Anaerolineae bacterium]
MKPLVYYCRWHDASLRLRGRDKTAVWGQLVYKKTGDAEETQNFRFNLKTWELTLEEEGEERVIQLDEMGVELNK